MMDGCSRFQAFRKITFPLLAPGLVATGVFGFIQAWNEFTLAVVVMTREDSKTLPVWLASFLDVNRGIDWGGVMAGSTLIAVPVDRLLPHRPGPDGLRPDRRGGEGMTLDSLALRVLLPSFDGTTVPADVLRLLEEGLGGLCLFGSNTADGPDAVAAYTADVRSVSPGAVIAVDEEGGDVTRLHVPDGSPVLGPLRARCGRRPRADQGGRPGDRPRARRGRHQPRPRPGRGRQLQRRQPGDRHPQLRVLGVRGRGARGRVDRRAAVGGRGGVRQALPRPRRHRRGQPPRAAGARCRHVDAGRAGAGAVRWPRSRPVRRR